MAIIFFLTSKVEATFPAAWLLKTQLFTSDPPGALPSQLSGDLPGVERHCPRSPPSFSQGSSIRSNHSFSSPLSCHFFHWWNSWTWNFLPEEFWKQAEETRLINQIKRLQWVSRVGFERTSNARPFKTFLCLLFCPGTVLKFPQRCPWEYLRLWNSNSTP